MLHFQHRERKDEIANRLRQQRGVRDQVGFIGVAQEKAQTFSARKEGSTFATNATRPRTSTITTFRSTTRTLVPSFSSCVATRPGA